MFILTVQKLSDEFFEKYGLVTYKHLAAHNWIYKTTEEKKQAVGTKDYAEKYSIFWSKSNIILCKIKYEDVGRIVHEGEKIRCFKIEILN